MNGAKNFAITTLFVVVVVLVTTIITEMAKVSIGDGAMRAVYGGVVGLLASMYWGQRQLNAFLIKGIADLRDLFDSMRGGQ